MNIDKNFDDNNFRNASLEALDMQENRMRKVSYSKTNPYYAGKFERLGGAVVLWLIKDREYTNQEPDGQVEINFMDFYWKKAITE